MTTRLFGIEIGGLPAGWRPGEFWRWWTAELLDMLPERLRRGLYPGPERLLLEFAEHGLLLSREDYRGVHPVQHLPLDGGEVEVRETLRRWTAGGLEPVLRLPARRVLATTISLPLAAEENLRQVVGFEMDRYTPFKVDQVYYDAYVLERQPGPKRLQVRLCAVPRRVLDEELARLDGWGLRPVAALCPQDAKANLLPLERRPRRRRLSLNINRLLLGLAGLLLAAVLILPLWQMREAVVYLNQRIAAVQPAVRAVESLRAERDRLEQDLRFIVGKKQSQPPTVEIIDELTRIVPDHTWLSRLQLQGDQLVIQGASSASSELIEIIEASPYFQDTAFRAPVTKNPRSGLEGFQIATRVRLESGL